MAADYTVIDAVVGVVLLIACVRGLVIGLIRESFSIAALGAAVLAARFGAEPGAAWLREVTGGETGPFPATWVAGTLIALAAAFGVAAIGYALRRSARWVGLSLADRLAGAALGFAEGTVVSMLIVLLTTFAIGRDHSLVAGSRSLVAYDALRTAWDERDEALPEVASPGPERASSR